MENRLTASEEKMFQKKPSRNLQIDLNMTSKRKSRQQLWQSMDFSV